MRRQLFQRNCRDRAAVDGLLAVAGIAGIRIYDPSLIVPELENLGTEFGAETATDTEIHINFRSSHSHVTVLSRG